MIFSKSFDSKKAELVEEQPSKDVDLHLVSAILMFSVIRSDGDTDKIELANMVDILRSRHALGTDEIGGLLETARRAYVNDKGIEQLTEKLCQHWGPRERAQLLSDFWELATADDEIKIDERLTIELIANNLQLDPDEITRARYQAEQKLELNIR